MTTPKTQELGDLVEIVTGYSARGRVEADPDAEFALLQTGDVDTYGHIDFGALEPSIIAGKAGPEPITPRQRHRLREGDVLFVSLGGGLRASHVEEHAPHVVAASSFFILRVVDPTVLDPGFLAWWLDQPPALAHFGATAAGTYQGRVNKAALAGVPMTLPPLDTQRGIARAGRLARQEDRLAHALADEQRTLTDTTLLRLAQGERTPTPNR